MSEERIESLKKSAAESAPETSQVIRIAQMKISNYRFFYGAFEIIFNSRNVLIYGENGSGKSSIYRAIEYLTKDKFKLIETEKNIFNESGDAIIEFKFDNGKEFIVHRDLPEIPSDLYFIKDLSIFVPMLDYKKLLKVHYSPKATSDKINIYDMLQILLKDFPVPDGKVLSAIEDYTKYFNTLKSIVNDELLDEINTLIGFFEADFKITLFDFKMEKDGEGRPNPVVNINIDFKGNVVENYHAFLNEARLSALAISLYFAAIKKMSGMLKGECLKIIVLDDLLISLDMSNRLKLLEILKSQFSDFQIFFFTHDKELFEIYKDKMPWEKYEIYLDDSEHIPKPIVKKGNSELERAKEYYAKKEFDYCALLLRKKFEKILKSYLTPKEQRDKNCNEIDLAGLIGRAIIKISGEAKVILEKLNSDRKHLLNPLCHDDITSIHSQEVKTAIADVEKLQELLK